MIAVLPDGMSLGASGAARSTELPFGKGDGIKAVRRQRKIPLRSLSEVRICGLDSADRRCAKVRQIISFAVQNRVITCYDFSVPRLR